MAEVIRSAQIPSTSSGELYELKEYDDGSVTCTCPFGSRRGVIPAGVRGCKHIEIFRRDKREGLLPPAWTDKEFKFDEMQMVRRLFHIFGPAGYLLDITRATINQDDKELAKIPLREAGSRHQPKPLSEEQRAVLVRIEIALEECQEQEVIGYGSKGSGNEVAWDFLHRALRLRLEEQDNSQISFRIQRGMIGEEAPIESE